MAVTTAESRFVSDTAGESTTGGRPLLNRAQRAHPTEVEVLGLLARGRTNHQVA